jgi:hypothetical protein
MDADPNFDGSIQIRRVVDKALFLHQHVYADFKKEKTVHSALVKYFENR